MKKGLISETAGVTAVLGALAISAMLSSTSIWTGANAAESMRMAAMQPAAVRETSALARAKAPAQPHWQQRFFDFDRSNARLAHRLSLTAAFTAI